MVLSASIIPQPILHIQKSEKSFKITNPIVSINCIPPSNGFSLLLFKFCTLPDGSRLNCLLLQPIPTPDSAPAINKSHSFLSQGLCSHYSSANHSTQLLGSPTPHSSDLSLNVIFLERLSLLVIPC